MRQEIYLNIGGKGQKPPGQQWHQLDNMKTICTSLQRDNYTNTSSLNLWLNSQMKNKAQYKKQYKTIYGTKCEKKIKKGLHSSIFW